MPTLALVRPYPGARWLSITRYAGSVEGMVRARGWDVAVAESPWWNPPSAFRGVARRHWRQPAYDPGSPADLVHFVDQALAHHLHRVHDRPTVVTCHDLMPFSLPGFYATAAERLLKQAFLRKSIAALPQASLVVTPSSVAAEHVREAGVDPKRVVVVPVALSPGFVGPPTDASLTVPLPPGPKIAVVGHCKEYKNLDLMLEALVQPGLQGTTLVRIGQPLTRRLRRKAAALGLEHRVHETGYLATPALNATLAACDLLAQPSRYEGFGMPVVEAMAIGVPVVSTDGGALAETVGEGGIVVPLEDYRRPSTADDARRFAAALGRVLESPAERDRLAAAGQARARDFLPDRLAPRLIAAYEQARELA